MDEEEARKINEQVLRVTLTDEEPFGARVLKMQRFLGLKSLAYSLLPALIIRLDQSSEETIAACAFSQARKFLELADDIQQIETGEHD